MIGIPSLAEATSHTIAYSGQILSPKGIPLEGDYQFLFRLYAQQSDTEPFYRFTSDVLPIKHGSFHISLPLNKSQVNVIQANPSIYVEIDGRSPDDEIIAIAARHSFYAVPYALRIPIDENVLYFDEKGLLSVKAKSKSFDPIQESLTTTGAEGQRGPKGEKGATGDRGPKGDHGDYGEPGENGDTGPKGATGPAGNNGTNSISWYADGGAPSSSLGQVGDYYVDTSANELYKRAETWSSLIDFGGDEGAAEWEVKTTDFSAQANTNYFVSTTGMTTVSLPDSCSTGDEITVVRHYVSGSTYFFLGTAEFNIYTDDSRDIGSYSTQTREGLLEMVCDSTTNTWYVHSNMEWLEPH